MKFDSELILYENLAAWREYGKSIKHTHYSELTESEKKWLRNLNDRLRQIEKMYSPILRDKYYELKAREADENDWLQEFNLELVITFYLREDDPDYEEDDDNVLMVIDVMGRDQSFGDEAENYRESHDHLGDEIHCYLYHDLYDHHGLDLRDLLRIGDLYVEVKIDEQSGALPLELFKELEPKNKQKKINELVDLRPISDIAEQMAEDFAHLYKIDGLLNERAGDSRVDSAKNSINRVGPKATWKEMLASIIASYLPRKEKPVAHDQVEENDLCLPKRSEIVLIATRSKTLSEELLLQLAHVVGIERKETVAIYSANLPMIQFVRKLIGKMSKLSTDVDLYKGELADDDIWRMTEAVKKLQLSSIYMYPIQMVDLIRLRISIHKLRKITSDIDLLLVDGVQYMTDENHRGVPVEETLLQLRAAASMLSIPVVAVYPLDSCVEGHESTLTLEELKKMEELSQLVDGIVLMSGTREHLVFNLPKIPNISR
jgi:hypothetical protein